MHLHKSSAKGRTHVELGVVPPLNQQRVEDNDVLEAADLRERKKQWLWVDHGLSCFPPRASEAADAE